MLLDEFDWVEGAPLHKLLASYVLLCQCQAMRLTIEQEEVSVWLGFVFGTGGEIFGQDRLRLGDDALGAGQRLEAREDPVPPEGELGVVWRGRVGIDEEEHVGCVFGGVGLLF